MRKTSLVSFKKLIESGQKNGLASLVMAALRRSRKPLTGREIDYVSGRIGLWKRLSELKRAGLIEDAGVRKCRISGRSVLTWRLKAARCRKAK